MNNEGKMSLGSFVFKINPRMIKISSRRNIVTRDIPYSGSKRTDFGDKGRLIQISGELCSADAAADFEKLRKLFDCGRARILYIPSQKPILALPKVLSLVGEDIEGVIGYSMELEESAETDGSLELYTLGNGAASLWDISYEQGISVEMLLSLNPDIRRPDNVIPAGRRIRLC